jgi:conjugative transposon TraM protein
MYYHNYGSDSTLVSIPFTINHHIMSPSKISKKQKVVFLAAIPLAVGIIVALLYGARSVGKSMANGKINDSLKTAFNRQLPSANLPDAGKNKLEIYMQAQKDSLAKLQMEAKDPYVKDLFQPIRPETNPYADRMLPDDAIANGHSTNSRDVNERKVNQRLEQLYSLIKAPEPSKVSNNVPAGATSEYPDQNKRTIEQLQKTMAKIRESDTTEDAQMEKYNTMLDKLLALQYPDKYAKASGTIAVDCSKPVSLLRTMPGIATLNGITLVSAPTDGYQNSFYGLSESPDTTRGKDAAIRAVVHQTQTLHEGSTIKLRLLQPVYIGEREIPKDQFIYGRCTVSDERLLIKLDKLIYADDVYPIALTVYDGADGQEGLSVPGAITRDASKQQADRLIQSMGINSIDPSLGAQVASAGLETARTLLSKKVKNIQVTAKAGDVLLLKSIR